LGRLAWAADQERRRHGQLRPDGSGSHGLGRDSKEKGSRENTGQIPQGCGLTPTGEEGVCNCCVGSLPT
jgi:hypothetical protein